MTSGTTINLNGSIIICAAIFYEDADGKRASSSFLNFGEEAIEHHTMRKMFCAGVIFEVVR